MNIDQRVRLMIGDLMISNASLMMQLEGCQKELVDKDREITDLKARLAPEKPKK